MKKFLCYDTNDAASGKINVDSRGILKPNSTVPSGSAPYQQLVTDGTGKAKWEDKLAYEKSRVVVGFVGGAQFVKVSDEVPSWASVNAPVKYWTSDGMNGTIPTANYTDLGNGSFFAKEYVGFITTDNFEFEGLVLPEKGVYFLSIPDNFYITGIARANSDTPEITWDGSFHAIKKLDEKFLPDMLILYATKGGEVLKSKDAANSEYPTAKEVMQAFFGRGVFIKPITGGTIAYEQVIAVNLSDKKVVTKSATFTFGPLV